MSLKHAILVLLNRHPGTGYDLAQRFNSGLGNFWNASHQQVYQELKKLDKAKLVEFQVEAQSDKPDKKVYRITRSGQRDLKAWLAEPAQATRIKDTLLVKVFGAQDEGIPALVAELDRHIERRRKVLEKYREMEQPYFKADASARREHLMPYLTLRRGIRHQLEWLDWLTETREFLAENRLPAKPVPSPRKR